MEGAHDVVVTVDVDLIVASESHLAATVFWEEHNVANVDVDFLEGSVFHHATGTNCNDGALVKLVTLAGGGEDNTRLGLGLLDDLLDHNTVAKGLN